MPDTTESQKKTVQILFTVFYPSICNRGGPNVWHTTFYH